MTCIVETLDESLPASVDANATRNGSCGSRLRSCLPAESAKAVARSHVKDGLEVSVALMKRGMYDRALASAVALADADAVDAQLLQAHCKRHLGRVPEAFAQYLSLVKLHPDCAEAHVAVASFYHEKRMHSEAVQHLQCALDLNPHDTAIQLALAVSLTDHGTELKERGAVEAALATYQHAIEVCESYAPAYYNIGVTCNEQQDHSRALEMYRKTVSLQPNHAQAHCNLGVILKQQGHLDEAIACYETAFAVSPNLGPIRVNLAVALTDKGTALKTEGDVSRAIEAYERALFISPHHANAMYNLGVVYGEERQYTKAIFLYEMAAHFNPRCTEAFNNLGVLYKELGDLDKAAECYSAALNINPNFPQSLNNLGVIYTSQGRMQDGLALLQAAIHVCPTYAEAHNNLGVLQRDVGAVEEAIASYETCMQLMPETRNAAQNRLLALNYIHPGESAFVCDAHREWGNAFQQTIDRLPAVDASTWDMRRDRVLRIGYISPDLFTHSVSYFAEAPLAHHNSATVHHIVYSCVVKPDAKTTKLQNEVAAAGGTWREVRHASEQAIAEMVRADKIDILVELTGHTADNRLGVMARCPAPIQVTWIGYPNSTGLEAVHYRFTDALCDPENTTQTFVETLVRLPGCFLCYTPADELPDVSPLPASTSGFVTFGSFNSLAKVTPQVMSVWGRILDAVPNSRLMLKNKPFLCEAAKRHYLQRLQHAGVDVSRVDLLPMSQATRDHLAMYSHLDVSLDPWPYAGTTTTCESFIMGVPCITFKGRCHAHNVGVSLISAVGLDASEWVANTEDEYVALAVAAVSDLTKLARLRQRFRQQMLASPMCNATEFVRNLEDTYRMLWCKWVDSHTLNGCVANALTTDAAAESIST